jgi:hypothetical protein
MTKPFNEKSFAFIGIAFPFHEKYFSFNGIVFSFNEKCFLFNEIVFLFNEKCLAIKGIVFLFNEKCFAFKGIILPFNGFIHKTLQINVIKRNLYFLPPTSYLLLLLSPSFVPPCNHPSILTSTNNFVYLNCVNKTLRNLSYF